MKNDTRSDLDSIKQAYAILYFGYIALPILAGLDKLLPLFIHRHLFTDWDKYLAPFFPHLLHIGGELFMRGAGVIEILAGLIVAIKPQIGAYIIAFWLLGIIINILILGNYYDIALRDFGLMLGALALGRLSMALARKEGTE